MRIEIGGNLAELLGVLFVVALAFTPYILFIQIINEIFYSNYNPHY